MNNLYLQGFFIATLNLIYKDYPLTNIKCCKAVCYMNLIQIYIIYENEFLANIKGHKPVLGKIKGVYCVLLLINDEIHVSHS